MIGQYRARATGQFKYGETLKGTEKVDVSFEIKEGEYEGQRLTWTGYFNTEANSNRAFKALRIAGWRCDDVLKLEGLGETDVLIDVDEEEYNGNVTTKIKWINSAKTELDETRLRSFAARMRGAAVASRSTNPAPSPDVSGPVPKQSDDYTFGANDDIPF